MISQKMLPPALRIAPVEEQLEYLLQRRRTIQRLMESLEAYIDESDGIPLKERNAAMAAA